MSRKERRRGRVGWRKGGPATGMRPPARPTASNPPAEEPRPYFSPAK